MDHKREHRTPPLAGAMGVGRQQRERRNLFNILETFGLVQRIELPTYDNGNLLDYIITRQSSEFASNFMVSD